MLGFWINYATDQIVANDAKTQWIVPLAFQLVPGVLLFVGMMFCPESPRWLAKGDNYESAERVLTMIRGLESDHSYIRHEMGEIRTQIEQRSTTRMSKTAKAKKLFEKGVRNRLGIGLALMFLQSFTGISLEDMDALFMRPTHKIVWAQLRRKPFSTERVEAEADVKNLEVEEIERR
ncbi:hypothetical protein KNSL1_006373 [Colletotrichum chrysophilum]|nr:hypothetical protein KNSL1_006373 [Colletotrichum chrysophilum]